MRKLVVVVVAAIIIAIAGQLSTVEETSAHSGYWRNVGNTINLREGPGGTYAIIGKVPSWGVVVAYGHVGNWLKLRVLASGQVGWAWLWNFNASSYVPPPPPAPAPALQTCFWNYWGATVCAASWVAQTIYAAAVRYGASYWALMSVAACESNFVVYAVNWAGPVYGLFQFRTGTYYGFGGWGDIYNVAGQADVAARMFSQGLSYHWHCAFLLGIASWHNGL